MVHVSQQKKATSDSKSNKCAQLGSGSSPRKNQTQRKLSKRAGDRGARAVVREAEISGGRKSPMESYVWYGSGSGARYSPLRAGARSSSSSTRHCGGATDASVGRSLTVPSESRYEDSNFWKPPALNRSNATMISPNSPSRSQSEPSACQPGGGFSSARYSPLRTGAGVVRAVDDQRRHQLRR